MSRLTVDRAREGLAEAKNRGLVPLCGKCGKQATTLLFCATGAVQGVGCDACVQAHRDFIETAYIFGVSGAQVDPFCSRCGVEGPDTDHVRTEPI